MHYFEKNYFKIMIVQSLIWIDFAHKDEVSVQILIGVALFNKEMVKINDISAKQEIYLSLI